MEREANYAAVGAFVLLGGTGVAERKHHRLDEALAAAVYGDTIEIRGNGPYIIGTGKESNNWLLSVPLTIRAGAGFQPVLVPQGTLITETSLVLEGLEFRRNPDQPGVAVQTHPLARWLSIANCRFTRCSVQAQSTSARIRNSTS